MVKLRGLLKSVIYGAVLGACALGASVALAAWSAPLNAAPTCTSGNPGCDVPLNVGANTQSKSGALLLNTGGATNGLIVQYGNVGIDTTNPSYKLQITSTGTGTGGAALSLNESGVRQWVLGAGETTSGQFSIVNESTGLDALTINGSSNVGVDTNAPTAPLTVYGGMLANNSSIVAGYTCSPEGQLGYDLTDHEPVYCNSAGTWTAISAGSSLYQFGGMFMCDFNRGAPCYGATSEAACAIGNAMDPSGWCHCPSYAPNLEVDMEASWSPNLDTVYGYYCTSF